MEAKGKIRIVSPDGLPHNTKVYIDGELVEYCTELTWRIGVGELSSATIRLDGVALDVEVDGDHVEFLTPSSSMTQNLVGCARCHGPGHEGLVFAQLHHPFVGDDAIAYTHWAPCPTNGQPIMLRMFEAPPPSLNREEQAELADAWERITRDRPWRPWSRRP